MSLVGPFCPSPSKITLIPVQTSTLLDPVETHCLTRERVGARHGRAEISSCVSCSWCAMLVLMDVFARPRTCRARVCGVRGTPYVVPLRKPREPRYLLGDGFWRSHSRFLGNVLLFLPRILFIVSSCSRHFLHSTIDLFLIFYNEMHITYKIGFYHAFLYACAYIIFYK